MAREELLKEQTTLTGSHGDYQILKLIGRGGMGAVYRVVRLADQTIWALKEMRPPPHTPREEIEENRQLFEQEAHLMSQLDHPNLPVLADYFRYEDRPVMVMEFIAGKTLEDQIHDANAPMLEQHVLPFGVQLCRVLHYLHTQEPPIIYRDLKPPNVMVTAEGVLKLIDFGVARTYKERKSKDTIAMGSAGYAPPEQYGRGQTDARSDIYALGATLLHLLTNVPPVPLQTPAPGYIRDFNPSVDPDTEQVIIKALNLDRSKRYQDCHTFEQAIIGRLNAPYADPTRQATPHPPIAAAGKSRAPAVVPQRAAQPVSAADGLFGNTSFPSTPATYRQPGASPDAPLPGMATGMPPQPAAPPSQPPAVPPPQPPPRTPLPADNNGSVCPACQYINKAGARFCANCGTPLAQPAARLFVRSPRSTWEMKMDKGSLPCRIGRRDPSQHHYPEIDLAEHDRGVASRHHATIQQDGDFYALMDLGSTNGTLVNGSRIAPYVPRRLRPGDKIKIGEVEIEFRWR